MELQLLRLVATYRPKSEPVTLLPLVRAVRLPAAPPTGSAERYEGSESRRCEVRHAIDFCVGQLLPAAGARGRCLR